MVQLHQDYQKFKKLNTEVIVIGPEKPKHFAKYWKENNLQFIGLPDPAHKIINLYGQEIKLLKLGRMPAQFIISKESIIQYTHYSQSMADIPPNIDILNLIKNIL